MFRILFLIPFLSLIIKSVAQTDSFDPVDLYYTGYIEKPYGELTYCSIEYIPEDGNFLLVYSPDRTKSLIYSGIPESRSKKKPFRIDIYDNDLNLLWNLDTTIISDKKFNPMNIALDNDGNVVLLLRTFLHGTKAGKIIVFKEKGMKITEQDIPFEVPNNNRVKRIRCSQPEFYS